MARIFHLPLAIFMLLLIADLAAGFSGFSNLVDKFKDAVEASTPFAESAVGKFKDAIEASAPFAESIVDKFKDAVDASAPFVESAAFHLASGFNDAVEASAPFAESAATKFKEAMEASAPFAESAAAKIKEAMEASNAIPYEMLIRRSLDLGAYRAYRNQFAFEDFDANNFFDELLRMIQPALDIMAPLLKYVADHPWVLTPLIVPIMDLWLEMLGFQELGVVAGMLTEYQGKD